MQPRGSNTCHFRKAVFCRAYTSRSARTLSTYGNFSCLPRSPYPPLGVLTFSEIFSKFSLIDPLDCIPQPKFFGGAFYISAIIGITRTPKPDKPARNYELRFLLAPNKFAKLARIFLRIEFDVSHPSPPPLVENALRKFFFGLCTPERRFVRRDISNFLRSGIESLSQRIRVEFNYISAAMAVLFLNLVCLC